MATENLVKMTKAEIAKAAKKDVEEKKRAAAKKLTKGTKAKKLTEKTKVKKAAALSKTDEEIRAKRARKEAEKLEKEALAAVAKKSALKILDTDAKEINVRFEKAGKLGRQADDHRLAAACKLADAKERCRENRINFQEWVEKNVVQSYETVRKLIAIGVAENEVEGAGQKLLSDMREGNAQRNREHRERQKAGKTMVKDTGKTKEQHDTVLAADKRSERENAELAFRSLGAKQKVAFAYWVAEQVGGVFTLNTAGEEEPAEE